ncbi:MAG TPA: DNA repair protein RadA [bacterium]|nr:DNA repair protein RadA [bacterium]
MRYRCSNCGYVSLRWSGKCPECDEWGTLEESEDSTERKSKDVAAAKMVSIIDEGSKKDQEARSKRLKSGYEEIDRVLGGGLVRGEVVLISGEPGIGKSTLLMQVANKVAKKGKVLYFSGEESEDQLRRRYKRISNLSVPHFYISSEIEVDSIIESIAEQKPDLVIIDSIQSIESDTGTGFPGSITQVRICGSSVVRAAKELNIPVLIVGQITKSGNIAGPKVLEHMVDAVLYFEGDHMDRFRILRTIKNRFGSTNEIGVFEMLENGLDEVHDPSKIFSDQGKVATSGSAIGAILKGSRVIFVEVQALIVKKDYEGVPVKRVANGISKSRLDMLTAVLTKRGGVFLGNSDVYINISGGLKVDETSLDLAICSAIKSAAHDKVVKDSIVFSGEVGLTGNVKGLWNVDKIISEASRIGYSKVVTGFVELSKKRANSIEVKMIPSISKLAL